MNNTSGNDAQRELNARIEAFLVKYKDALRKHRITKKFVREESHLFKMGMRDEQLLETIMCIWDECHMMH